MELLAIKGGPRAIPESAIKKWPYTTDEDKQAVVKAMEYGIFSNDTPQIYAFEREWASYVGVKHCLATNSGTAALHMCMAGAGISAGDEVIAPAYTFVATGTSVLHNNAIPVFVDVEPDTWNIDPAKIERAITPYTRGIVAVHLNGYPAEMDTISAIARRHNLVVIEDACQSHGAEYKRRKTGTLGHLAAFSLNSWKNLPAGDGGFFVTDDEEYLERAAMLREFGERICKGQHREYKSYALGCMYRTTEFVGAYGRSQLKRLDEMNARRIENARFLRDALRKYSFIEFPKYREEHTCVYWFFPIKVSARKAGLAISDKLLRDKLMLALRAEGLRVSQWQTVTLPAQSVFRDKIGYGKGSPWSDKNYRGSVQYEPEHYPVAQMVVDCVLWLCNMFFWPATLEDQKQYTLPAFEKVLSQLEEVVSLP